MDGTLIDSAQSILMGYEHVVRSAGFKPIKKIDNALIGPTLNDALLTLIGEVNPAVMPQLIDAFKRYYDEHGYQKSIAYPGIYKLLHQLKKKEYSLMLATNKRITPTLKIIDYLKWTNIFDVVYSIDLDAKNPFPNKKSMLADLIQAAEIDSRNAVYIGDRLDDQEAALQNNMQSITVGWGYDQYVDTSVYSAIIWHPAELIPMLDRK